LLKCKEIGLELRNGEIIKIVNKKDKKWWKEKKVGSNGKDGMIK
jgi:hypothetical protein